MERRELLKGMLMVIGAGAVGLSVTPAQAATQPPVPELNPDEVAGQPQEPETAALDDAEKDSEGQYYYYRRRRRRVYYRRPRRVYYRRPRRVYYYRRPRRVYVRRYYW